MATESQFSKAKRDTPTDANVTCDRGDSVTPLARYWKRMVLHHLSLAKVELKNWKSDLISYSAYEFLHKQPSVRPQASDGVTDGTPEEQI